MSISWATIAFAQKLCLFLFEWFVRAIDHFLYRQQNTLATDEDLFSWQIGTWNKHLELKQSLKWQQLNCFTFNSDISYVR